MKFFFEPIAISVEPCGSWKFVAINRLIHVGYESAGPFSGSWFRFRFWPFEMMLSRGEFLDERSVKRLGKRRLAYLSFFGRGFMDWRKCERTFHGNPNDGYDEPVPFGELVRIMLKFQKVG